MDGENAEEKNNKVSKKRLLLVFGTVLLLVAGLGFYVWQKFPAKTEEGAVPQVEKEVRPESLIINENMAKETLAEDPAEEPGQGMLESESYVINNINIGGNIMMIPDDDNQLLQVSNIKSEAFLNDKKGEVKLVITWQTNKLAISEVEYSKKDGKNPKMVKEGSYGFNHSAVIAGLEPGMSYMYRIICKDRWGNEEKSGYFGMYAPPKFISIFDMITSEVEKMFGWAVK